MTSNDQSLFWDSISPTLRHAVELAIPPQTLQIKLSLAPLPNDLASKYTHLESLIKDIITRNQHSNPTHDQMSATPHLSPIFPLALLYSETHRYTAAEELWRSLLRTSFTSNSDLAAMSNLIEVLNLQHKYPEAEILALELLPLLQRELGENSPRALGCLRKLMLSLVGQGRKEEAREVYTRGVELVASIEDYGLRKDEGEAMHEMGQRIDSLA